LGGIAAWFDKIVLRKGRGGRADSGVAGKERPFQFVWANLGVGRGLNDQREVQKGGCSSSEWEGIRQSSANIGKSTGVAQKTQVIGPKKRPGCTAGVTAPEGDDMGGIKLSGKDRSG